MPGQTSHQTALEYTGPWESQNVSNSLVCRILSTIHMMPTSLGPSKEHLLSWYPAEMIMLYNTACQKAHLLCELMPNQAPYDISLSISKKSPDSELTDSICLWNYFYVLEALKCIVAKRGGKAFEGKCQGFSSVDCCHCYSSSTISPVLH